MSDDIDSKLAAAREKMNFAEDEYRNASYQVRSIGVNHRGHEAAAAAVEALPVDATQQQIAAASWRALATQSGNDEVAAMLRQEQLKRAYVAAVDAYNALVREVRTQGSAK